MRILCFGDSNTWGDKGGYEDGRFENRWPVSLQRLLADDEVVENSQNGRTLTDLDVEKKSFDVFVSEVEKGYDVVVLALGVNDTKPKYGLSGLDIVELVEKFSATAIDSGAKVVLIGPVMADLERIPWNDDFTQANNDKIAAIYTAFPHAIDCRDLELVEDGLHLSETSHEELAKRVAEVVKSLF